MTYSDNPTFDGLIPTAELCEIIRSFGIKPIAILDAGACDGRDSLVFKSAFPLARVVAIEGLAENYSRWLAGLPGIEVYHRVLAKQTGLATFHVKDINGIHGIYDRGQEYGVCQREVIAFSLDDFCAEIGFAPDVLKIDCEGATFDIMAGGGRVLADVAVICCETETIPYFASQVTHEPVAELLRSHGFVERLKRGGAVIVHADGRRGNQFESIWSRA